ncbi:MAG: DUF1839 family protein [Chromatiales bacterium]
MSTLSALNLDVARYTRHRVHGESAVWVEKNCYVDVWIEVADAAGLDPMAMLPFTLASDFDGDQWTFFKPSHEDLTALYGFGVQELNLWRPLLQHVLFHLAERRLIFTEADAYYLPDTSGTDYRTNHVKTTIVIETIDLERRRLGYFHNAGYFQLEGDDFIKLLRVDAPPDPTFMPLFAELVKLDRIRRLEPAELTTRSLQVLALWLPRRPRTNPFRRFAARFGSDIDGLKKEGIAAYHAYAFATMRQCGANFELTAEYLRWLERQRPSGYDRAAPLFDAISNGSKTLILKAARAVGGNQNVDFVPLIEEMATAWDTAMRTLETRSPR